MKKIFYFLLGLLFANYAMAELIFTSPSIANNYIPPSKELRAQQWNMLDAELYSIQADTEVWKITKGDPNLYIGVIDTGSCPQNPSLQNTFVGGYDFVINTTNPENKNGNWHGCAVAGVIAAHESDTANLEGVAPNVKIVALNVFGREASTTPPIVAKAIRWAIGEPFADLPRNPHPVKALNISLGSEFAGGSDYACPPELQAALDEAYRFNIPVVVSAGNDNKDANIRFFPNCEHVIAVASTNQAGNKAASNYGNRIAIAAPGDNILVTIGSEYAHWSGTSFAAPHVTGTIALLYSVRSDLDVDTTRAILQHTARPFAQPQEFYIGPGIVNALNAVRSVTSSSVYTNQ